MRSSSAAAIVCFALLLTACTPSVSASPPAERTSQAARSDEARGSSPAATTRPTPSATPAGDAEDPLVATVIEYVTARTLLDHADPATLTRFQAVVDEELGRLGRDLWEIENVPDGTAELSSAQSFTAPLSGQETAHFVEACIRFIEAPAPMRYIFVLDPSETSPTGWIIAGSSVEAPCELAG